MLSANLERLHKTFDEILNVDTENNIEFWYATEMINHNVNESDLQGEESITKEHVQNNSSVRDMLGKRGIKPEELPPAEDIKKLERRVKSGEKKLAHKTEKLPEQGEVEK